MKQLVKFIVCFLTMSYSTMGQVGVGTTSPDASSILDISSADKGILVPRVSLADVANTLMPIATPATGLLVWNTNAAVTGGNGLGFYFFNGAQWIPIQQALVDDHDFYEEGTTTAPNDINDDQFTLGNLAIGKNTADWRLDIEEPNGGRGAYIHMTGANNGTTYGLLSQVANSGDATHVGLFGRIIGNGDGAHRAVESLVSGNGIGAHYGLYSSLIGTGNGEQFGVRTLLSNTGDSMHYGVYNELTGFGIGDKYGVYNELTGIGTGDKYGTHNIIAPTAGGTHYGLYSEVLKLGSYAGYFLGNVSIGTTGANSYILPSTRGTSAQIMQTDGTGNVSWADASTLVVPHRIDDLLDGKSDAAGTSVFLGVNAGAADNLSNNRSVGIGFNALTANVNGSDNIGIGYNSMQNLNGGIGNVATGYRSMISNLTGNYNTAIATDALYQNIDGDYNAGIGSASLYNNTTGNNNVAIGTAASGDNNSGNNNVAVGFQTLRQNSIGNNNVSIGYQAGYRITGSNNVTIGFQAGYNENGSNRLYIDNSNSATPLIYGEFDTDLLHINGRTEITSIADATPLAGSGALEIANSLRIDGNEIITNANNPLYLQNDNNGDLRVDATTFAVDASSNRVGIGTLIPAFQLQLTTNSAAKPTSNVWTVASDERLKTNVKPFTDGLALINKINPVWFTYNGKAGMPNETGVGTLAQEFKKIAPYMVKPWDFVDEEKGVSETYLGIDYGPLNFVMVNAIKEQQDQLEELIIQNEILKEKLEAQEQEMNEIKALLNEEQ